MKALDFPVSPKLSERIDVYLSKIDPTNVLGAKDLLGHASFQTIEKHYIMGRSRLAGRALARVIKSLKEYLLQSPSGS